MLPPDIHPRLGGSASLYFRGLADGYRDIDIVVDSIDGISLPFPKIELIHKRRLNRTIKYCIDGMEVDILESIFTDNEEDWNPIMEISFVPIREVRKAKTMITYFLNQNKE